MAQSVIFCQFCEISDNVKWKCIVCDLKLCERCKNNHSKFKGSEEHCIIDVTQVNPLQIAETIRKLDLKNILCSIHEEEKCSLFCKDCNKPMCSLCILESNHKGHDLEKVGIVYDNHITKLKILKNTLENQLTLISKTDKESTNPITNYLEIKTKIDKRENEIKEIATKQAEKLKNELDKVHMQNVAKKQNKEKRENIIKKTKKEIDTALKSHKASKVLATIGMDNIDLPLKRDLDNPFYQKLSLFLPDLTSINLGHLKKCPIFQIVKTYDATITRIDNLQSLQNGTLVCTFKREDTLFLGYCNIQGDKFVIETETELGMKTVKDMTVTGDNKILFTTNSDEIMYLNAYDKEERTFEIKNHDKKRVCSGIHSNDHGEILAGFFQYENIYDEDNYADEIISTGIMFINNDGYRSKTYKRIESIFHGDTMFSYLDKLTTNINGDINILDSERIIVLDSNCQVKWKDEAYSCKDIVTTSEGLVVVACKSTNRILAFSIEGDLVNSMEEQDGIYHPTCLHIDKSGQLLIGCDGRENNKSRIHVVKIYN